MQNTYTSQSEIAFSEVPPQELISEKEELGLTTLEAIDGAERLPKYIFEELGESITQKILKGSGSLELCIGDRGLTVIPETKTVLIPVHSRPYAEHWVRGPWHDAVANFDKSFLTLHVTPEKNSLERSATDFGNEDIEEMSTGKVLKDSSINLEGIFADDASTVVDKKTFSRVKSLVAAGLQRGLLKENEGEPHQRLAVTEIPDISKLSPKEIVSYYQRMYRGPQTGTDYTGIGILEEGVRSNAMSAEDRYFLEESGFSAEILTPTTNLMEGLMSERMSLAKEYIEPILPIINSEISKFNTASGRRLYTKVKHEDLVGTLFYKKDEQSFNGRSELKDNLIPIVLSPEVRIFRGHRGVFEEDTLVVVKTGSGWRAHFFEYSNGEESLGERIDKWIENSKEI